MNMQYAFAVVILVATGEQTIAAKTKSSVYEGKLNGTLAPVDIVTSGNSEIDCAHQCTNDVRCRRFFFSVDVGECYFFKSSMSLNDGLSVTFGRKCRTDLGYATYQIGSKQRCLKYNFGNKNYADAIDDCMSANGHLYTLESEDDARILYSLYGRTCFTWIDGGTDGITFDGRPLPWTAWKTDQPAANRCPIQHVYNPLSTSTSTYTCTIALWYTCQIDI